MNVSASIPQTVQIRRSRLLGLIALVAALAAGVTWALLAVAFPGDSRETAAPNLDTGTSVTPEQRVAVQWGRGFAPLGRARVARGAKASVARPLSSAAQDARRVPSIMSLTPAQLAGGALGTGYALPAARRGPTTASVLASMNPETRRYTEAVMNLTFAQLAAGAAGHL